MARLKNAVTLLTSRDDELKQIRKWYRDSLESEPAPDWSTNPRLLGPTWRRGKHGWLLPDHSLGWDLLAWCGYWLRDSKTGNPWKWTLEQARFWLWYYALDDSGKPLHDTAVLQRLKGWGKDPMAAAGALASCFAPLTFESWKDGEPIGHDEPNAWVQVCAVSQEQTKNTMKLLPGLLPAETRRHYGIQLGKLNMYALGDSRQIEAVTSSPLALEGGRPTFVIRNETQNWNRSNGGLDMDGVLSGNAAKREATVNVKMLDICNAYRDGEDSVAQRVREAWEGTQGDPDSDDSGQRPKYMDFGLLYDSIEAAPDSPMTAESIPRVIHDIRGDSTWLSTPRIVKDIINPKNPVSESRRKWFNQCMAPEDAFVTSQEWDANMHPDLALEQGERIVMFLDCSLTDDATALVACRVSDGFVKPLGMWQKPAGARGRDWRVPRESVDDTVREAFRRYSVVGFWGDPSHVIDDETGLHYWDALFDTWHREFGRKLKVWAQPQGRERHAVMFDMVRSDVQKRFVQAVSQAYSDIDDKDFPHDGDARLRAHMLNARRQPTRVGMSIAKEHRESRRKIDLAFCAIGARMVRREFLNSKHKSGGQIW
ncbi:MAG: terminase [Bifidobacterium tsurumiense]|uniref:terminase n=1 Tax=Bifidobacterium tsurumiense TaxID=356829 RepID=UPI002A80B825|nr:terminase [Bifidobacterium tsurumiense]MDY4677597.1 terminase [Bifidobacterium tsurumiense]